MLLSNSDSVRHSEDGQIVFVSKKPEFYERKKDEGPILKDNARRKKYIRDQGNVFLIFNLSLKTYVALSSDLKDLVLHPLPCFVFFTLHYSFFLGLVNINKFFF